MPNYWWVVRFGNKISVTYFDTIPPIPNIGPYWTKAEALKKLRQWGYMFSMDLSLFTRKEVMNYA